MFELEKKSTGSNPSARSASTQCVAHGAQHM